jgi:hypothetical protein
MKDPKGPVKAYKSPEELAKKHKVSLEYIMKQVKIGTKVEGEHTTSKSGARITALQHIDERPDYYLLLKKVEKTPKTESLNYDWDTPIRERPDRYCPKCEKIELRHECKYGPKYWDMYSLPAEVVSNKKDFNILNPFSGPQITSSQMLTPNQMKYNSSRPHPANESKIHEDHKEIASGKRKDDEGYMANLEMDKMERCIEILRKIISKPDHQLPAWVQSKITRAADFIDSAAEYLSSDESDEVSEEVIDEKKGLWDNIHARREKGLPPKKPGQKGYPKTLDIEEGLKQARKNVGASKCWTNKKVDPNKPTKMKGGKEVPNCVPEGYSNWREEIELNPTTFEFIDLIRPEPLKPTEGLGSQIIEEDWQSVNRKDKTDGLSQAAVNAYRKENPGSKLQTAVTEKNPKGKRADRRSNFCSRMKGMKSSKLTSAETARDPDSRINKALRRWNCN